MYVKVYKTYKEIDPVLWNMLIDEDDIFANYKFLKVVENSGFKDIKFWYLTVFQNKELVSTVPLFHTPVNIDDLMDSDRLQTLSSNIRKLFSGFMTFKPLIVGLPVSLGRSNWRFKKGLSLGEKHQIVNEVVLEIEKIAKSNNIKFIAFKEYLESELDILQPLLKNGYACGDSLPTNYLNLPWHSFKEYTQDLRSKYRQNMSYNLKKISGDVGIEVIKDYSELFTSDLYRQYISVMSNAGIKLEVLTKEFFIEFNREFSEEAELITVKKGEEVIGFFLTAVTPNSVVAMFAGLNYKYNFEYDVYFNLFFEVIRQAADLNKKYVDFGQNSYRIKSRLGCGTKKLYIFFKHKNNLINLLLDKGKKQLFPETVIQERNVFKSR